MSRSEPTQSAVFFFLNPKRDGGGKVGNLLLVSTFPRPRRRSSSRRAAPPISRRHGRHPGAGRANPAIRRADARRTGTAAPRVLERDHDQAGRGRHRRTHHVGRVQKIRCPECGYTPVPAHVGDSPSGPRRRVRRDRRYSGEHLEIVRKHYAKWSKGRQDRIDNAMLSYVGALGEIETADEEYGYRRKERS